MYISLPSSGSRPLFSASGKKNKQNKTLYTLCQAQKTKAIAAKKPDIFVRNWWGPKQSFVRQPDTQQIMNGTVTPARFVKEK